MKSKPRSSRRQEAPTLALQIAAVSEAANTVRRSHRACNRWDNLLEERYYRQLVAAEDSLRAYRVALVTQHGNAAVSGDRECVYCGCSDSHACPGGCTWMVEHSGTNTGVCSNSDCMHAFVSDLQVMKLKMNGLLAVRKKLEAP